ncbi:MFS transporter [Zunongwangia sp.]|uniref:MFS transporter n=1 Tax=Zunongwangia sp. TaxID=1965325 RepID=UPI003AA85401
MERTTAFQKGLLLAILLIAAILSPLDFYIVNLALTPIQKELHTTEGHLQMIISLYTCAYAVFQITGGRLGDLFGTKHLFLIGLMGFVISSAICGLAYSPSIIITGRIMQGISGALLAPQILSIIHTTFSDKEKTKVMALYSFVFGIAAVLGQYLGGILIAHNIGSLGWRIIFLINIPIGLIAWVGAIFFLPKSEKQSKEYIDVLGMVLLSFSLTLIVYPLTLLGENGFSFSVVAMLVSSILFSIWFIKHEKAIKVKNKSPLIDITLFKYKNLSFGSIVAFLYYNSGVFFLILALYLQEGQNWTAQHTGATMIPFGIGFLVFSLISPLVVRRIGDYILNTGIALYALGFLVLILSISNPSSLLFTSGLFIAGAGMGTTLASIVRISLKGIPSKFSGLASGVINCALQIGSAIGVTAIGSIFFSLRKSYNHETSFQYAMLVVVALLMVAFFVALPIIKQNEEL